MATGVAYAPAQFRDGLQYLDASDTQVNPVFTAISEVESIWNGDCSTIGALVSLGGGKRTVKFPSTKGELSEISVLINNSFLDPDQVHQQAQTLFKQVRGAEPYTRFDVGERIQDVRTLGEVKMELIHGHTLNYLEELSTGSQIQHCAQKIIDCYIERLVFSLHLNGGRGDSTSLDRAKLSRKRMENYLERKMIEARKQSRGAMKEAISSKNRLNTMDLALLNLAS